MNDFLLVFRTNYDTMNAMPDRSPEEMQANAIKWMDWIKGIADQQKLVDIGKRLMPSGKVVKAESIIADGPFAEIKEYIVGYTVVKAANLEEAADLAKGCPIIAVGGTVEVREISPLDPAFKNPG